MKDIQGIQRGKCTSNCECEEYRPPPPDSTTGKLRCEYCNHTPGEHIKIISLGSCNSCGEENCEKYEPEDDKSYSDCQYCGCSAGHHAGAEKLIKKKVAGSGHIDTSQAGASFSPRVNEHGMSVQSSELGTCKRSGCQYPRRFENGRSFDYCSRTCATKDAAATSSSAMAFTKDPHSASKTCAPPVMQILHVNPNNKKDVKFVTLKTCEKCKANPANEGHKWCEKCYTDS